VLNARFEGLFEGRGTFHPAKRVLPGRSARKYRRVMNIQSSGAA
jgi:hypothetical protein